MEDDGEGGRDTGPKGELEYWRNRMQRLTSITEQLKRKVCKLTTTKNRRNRCDYLRVFANVVRCCRYRQHESPPWSPEEMLV